MPINITGVLALVLTCLLSKAGQLNPSCVHSETTSLRLSDNPDATNVKKKRRSKEKWER